MSAATWVVRVVAVAAVSAAALVLGGAATSAVNAHPTAKEIRVQTRSAVKASGASVVAMRVVGPNVRYAVRIKASDPAAYLKYRVHRVLGVMNRLTNRLWLFRSRTVAVVDRSGRIVLSVSVVWSGSTLGTRYYVRPGLEDCARNIAYFDLEIDPENIAPPCPA